jgi:hypothetical protein
MNCKSFSLWLGSCVLGLLGLAGCRHADSSCSSCASNSSVVPYSYNGGPILQSLRSVSRPGTLPEHVCAPEETASPDMSSFASDSCHGHQAAAAIEPVVSETPQEETAAPLATAEPSATPQKAIPGAALPPAHDAIGVIRIPNDNPEPQPKATG